MTDRPLAQAAQFWDAAAESYEEAFSGTVIGTTRREAVWRDLARIFQAGDRVLEIACGTGLDAVFLAGRGVELVACDLSPGMIAQATRYAAQQGLAGRVRFMVLPTEELGQLPAGPPFSGAFSNFAGLNCVEDLSAVRADLARLLPPGAPLYLCMMGRIVPAEMLWFLLRGSWKRAFHRLRPEGENVGDAVDLKIYRPTVRTIRAHFEPAFRLRRRSGIGITVPPSSAEALGRRLPRLVRALAQVDRLLGPMPVFRDLADCVILEFERADEPR